jgi:large-conductance mechanosensitive channel
MTSDHHHLRSLRPFGLRDAIVSLAVALVLTPAIGIVLLLVD